MIPRAMTTIVQEGIEPMLIGSSLLQKVGYKPGMTTVFPAIEPLRADEAGDGMDLPIYNINIAGAQSFGVTVKRHGLRLKIAKSRSLRPVPEQQARVRASKTTERRSPPYSLVSRLTSRSDKIGRTAGEHMVPLHRTGTFRHERDADHKEIADIV